MSTLETLSIDSLTAAPGQAKLLLRLLLPRYFDSRVYGVGEAQLVRLCTGLSKRRADRSVVETVARNATGEATWTLTETDEWLDQLAARRDAKRRLPAMMRTLNRQSVRTLAGIILRDTGCGVGPAAALAMVDPTGKAYSEFVVARGHATAISPALAAVRPINERLVKGGVWVERKYDGERIQLHSIDGNLTAWSRQLKPLAIDTAAFSFAKSNFIIDGELVLASDGGRSVIPFGSLGVNERRLHPDATEWIFAFDCLSIDGRDVTLLPIEERRQCLASIVTGGGAMTIVEPVLVTDTHTLVEMMAESKALGHEGFVAKRRASPYRAGCRDWTKLKHSVTVDLVPVGAWKGKGKLANYYSVFQLADATSGMPVCRVSGLAIEMLEQLLTQYKFVLDATAKRNQPPFKLVGPRQVWEIEGQSLTEKSIRHPRFLRVRTDL